MASATSSALTVKSIQRYNSIAISLHWLIAFFLIGLLVSGKYMTSLEESDPSRFVITQWHKSFGITVLFLAVVRILWRLTHKPPALPADTRAVERIGSAVTHHGLYLLMVVIPFSGWVMVSASSLNIPTELFGVIPWPHMEWVVASAEREVLAERAENLHTWLGNALIVLVLLHASAAFFHQLVHRDRLLSRMVVSDQHKLENDSNFALIPGALLAFALGLFLFASTQHMTAVDGGTKPVPTTSVAAAESETAVVAVIASTVGFKAMQMGEPLVGTFADAEVTLSLDPDQLDAATLVARVRTESVSTGDSQMDGTVVTQEWFASAEYPYADFVSERFQKIDESSYTVAGEMTIRGVSNPVNFTLQLQGNIGGGELAIIRSDYGIGEDGQDEFIEQHVVIEFSVQNSAR